MQRHAFSLVELSIVLVILGLLTGGILAGQSLIKAAELRSVGTEYNRYTAAIHSFRDKYFALPGDMNNAVSFWTQAAAGAACVTTVGTGTQTCNGDGNGLVYITGNSNETFRFWQHLANAGLVEGSYTGVTDGSNFYSATRNNSPTSKYSNGLWSFWPWPATNTSQNFDNLPLNRNTLYLGKAVANTLGQGLLTPEEMWNVDTKMDDGRPALGKIVVNAFPQLSACTTATGGSAAAQAADYANANYRLDNGYPGAACGVIFRNEY